MALRPTGYVRRALGVEDRRLVDDVMDRARNGIIVIGTHQFAALIDGDHKLRSFATVGARNYDENATRGRFRSRILHTAPNDTRQVPRRFGVCDVNRLDPSVAPPRGAGRAQPVSDNGK